MSQENKDKIEETKWFKEQPPEHQEWLKKNEENVKKLVDSLQPGDSLNFIRQ